MEPFNNQPSRSEQPDNPVKRYLVRNTLGPFLGTSSADESPCARPSSAKRGRILPFAGRYAKGVEISPAQRTVRRRRGEITE